MSTQQDIYAAGSESHPPMLNKENMFHGRLVFSAVDSFETAQEIWLRVQQMMKGSDIGIQEKKAKNAKGFIEAWEKFFKIQHAQPEDIQELLRKLLDDLQIISEELAEYINSSGWNYPAFYDDDDDDEESFIPLRDIIFVLPLSVAITPDFSITNSLSMGDEHLSTILERKSDELIKPSVENLFPYPSESKDLSRDLSDIESERDIPVCDDFTTFSNSLFDANDNFSSSDDESFYDEEVPKEIYSNPLFDEEIISIKIDPHHFNVESDRIKSLLNQDSSIISSPKIDSLLEEFFDELAHINLIPLEINEADFDPEEEIHLVGSDSLKEEIDIFLAPDNSIPPGFKNDDYDSEGDILFLKELLSNYSPLLLENDSFHFDVPSSPRPPAKPTDDEIYFETDTGLLTAKVVGDISKQYDLMPRLLATQPTLCPMIDTLLSFSSENEDKVHLLSYRGFKAFQLIFESPMMIYGGNIPILDVPFLHFYPP
uniref:Reverse transcriptase domain-containing protein n=1 Tax=Tanacetum cinerariifolium TaxID=118510 RepID=A0A6L2JSW7_TANCI|nr:hypothetical protein [Tanacetum cinerariifolium]